MNYNSTTVTREVEHMSDIHAGFGRKIVFEIPKADGGDLISDMRLQVTLPEIHAQFAKWTECVGFKLLQEATLKIGDTVYDYDDGWWSYIWESLSSKNFSKVKEMVSNNSTNERTIYIPLHFFCSRHPSMALPLSRLTERVTITICLAPIDELLELYTDATMTTSRPMKSVDVSNTEIIASTLFVLHTTLSQANRTLLFNRTNPFPMEEVKAYRHQVGVPVSKIPIPNIGLCKELIWATRDDSYSDRKHHTHKQFNFTDSGSDVDGENPIITAKIGSSNGDVILEQEGNYFNLVQPRTHHSNYPNTGVNCFSFSRYPELAENTGYCDFSQFEKIWLSFILGPKSVGGCKTTNVLLYSLLTNTFTINGAGKAIKSN